MEKGLGMGGVLACFKLIRSLSSSCAVAASLSVRGTENALSPGRLGCACRNFKPKAFGRGQPVRTAAAAASPKFLSFLLLTHSCHCEVEQRHRSHG